MRAATHHIGPAHDGGHVAGARSLCCCNGGGELAHGSALGKGFFHVRYRGVVVAGQGDAVLLAIGGEIGAVRLGIAGLVFFGLGYAFFKLGLAPAFFAGEIDPRVLDVFPLALARRVVHQRHHAHQRVVDKRRKQFQRIGRGQLAAHMQQVVCAQHATRRKVAQAFQHRVPFAAAHAVGVRLAHAQRVEHRGDSCRRNLGVMGQERRGVVPTHLGAGHEVALKIVGVHFHHAGNQVVALQVHGADGGAIALVYGADRAALALQAAVNYFVCQHQAGVGKGDGGACRSVHGAGEIACMATVRLATAWATTWS